MSSIGGRSAGVTRDGRTLAFAWLVTLVLSSLPAITAVELAGVAPAAAHWSTLAAAAPLSAVAWTWPPARPVLRYLLVVLAAFCAAYLLPPLLGGWTGAGGSDLGRALFGKTVFLLVAAAMAGLLVTVLRMTPTEAFLTPGDMAAPSGARLPGRSSAVSWAVLGPVAAGALFALLATMTWLESGLEPAALERLTPLLPLVIGCAAFNALGEEVVYRSGPLATLVGVVGSRQAVLLTSVWFGLAHYSGSVPEGFGGVLQSGALALLLGGAMVATRGLGWPFLIHVAVDLVVFASIAVVGT
ncbi:CPBP family intramembrane glutamic endopeptidase [Geodermatophilus sp. URMC 61]|uniref:CPBP family intramembrane glutamic endopeptidase n=1 Tax=Geodermatophilus sp. URMC 61 TaxID=3423411 RepID=UPI00406CA522